MSVTIATIVTVHRGDSIDTRVPGGDAKIALLLSWWPDWEAELVNRPRHSQYFSRLTDAASDGLIKYIFSCNDFLFAVVV